MQVEIVLRINGAESIVEYSNDPTARLMHELMLRLPELAADADGNLPLPVQARPVRRRRFRRAANTTGAYAVRAAIALNRRFTLRALVTKMQELGWTSKGSEENYRTNVRGTIKKIGTFHYLEEAHEWEYTG